jgi:hypothetical protein
MTGEELKAVMKEHGADLVEMILCEGIPDNGYKTFAPRGYHLYSSKTGYIATVLWGMDNENRPKWDRPAR